MKLTILRGISGSGKTTWARTQASTATVVSADSYFEKEGSYHFDVSKLQENHRKCFRAFMEALLRKDEWIVVDNTNISAWEYSPYVIAAEAYGYSVELLTLVCSVEISLARKNLVSADKLRSSLERLDRETRSMPGRFKEIHRIIDTSSFAM